jgi:hypothetical protein
VTFGTLGPASTFGSMNAQDATEASGACSAPLIVPYLVL